jgi:tellurite resistance protein
VSLVRDVPIGMYGAVMGLTGLGLTARAAASVLPGYVRAPAYVTEPWIALGVLFFIVLVPLYVVKLARYPHAVREEFTNPMQLGFCGALPVGMFLVGGGLAPYWFALGDAIWWIGFALLLPFQIWALTRWLSGSIDLAHINAGWLIVMVGGIVAPGPGIALGHADASRFIFGISAAAAPILMALLFYRAIIGAPLPDRFRPTWFILLVPPSLIYANGLALYPGSDFLEPLFFFGLALALALLLVSRSFPRWPYGPPWWAFTFPLDALAYAAARYAQDHPAALWKAVAGATLLLAVGFVLAALVKSVAALPLAFGRSTARSGASPRA